MFTRYKNQIILLLANVFLVVLLIGLSNLQILPLRMGDFIFFAILVLVFSLYRPGWAFLFFVGTIVLENINLAPAELGISVRPYQFFGGITIAAILIRLLGGKLNFKLVKLELWDWAVVILGVAGFVSAIFSENTGSALKQSIVLASFIFLYFLVRNLMQTPQDVRRILSFFLSSSIIVALYSIWQNVRFSQNLSSFEVMPGRPNGTFAEADWLGLFVTFVIAVIYSLIFFFNKKKGDSSIDAQISNSQFLISKQFQISNFKILKTALYLILATLYITLIIAVSRSAWLGVLVATFFYLFIVLTGLTFKISKWRWREFLQNSFWIVIVAVVSFAVVYFFNLTNFELGNRLQSTGSGKQEITVSCDTGSDVPRAIVDISELNKFNCTHINLEEIENEKISGRVITRAYRDDPNVNIRAEIYKKSWEEIKRNPVLGIGWGNISNVLGKDDRGAGLNSSNIFLEVWLGAGILGLLAFVVIWLGVVIRAIRLFLDDSFKMKTVGIFLLLGSVAIIVPNLFNAGLMLGFVWLFLGSTFINNKK